MTLDDAPRAEPTGHRHTCLRLLYYAISINEYFMDKYFSPLLQKTFLAVFSVSYLAPVVMLASNAFRQFSRNPNLSSFEIIAIQAVFAPIILFGISYYFASAHRGLNRLFFASILTAIGASLMSVVFMASNSVQQDLSYMFGGYDNSHTFIHVGTGAVAIATFFGILAYLRSNKAL